MKKLFLIGILIVLAVFLSAAEQILVTLNGTSGELRHAFPGGYTLHQKFSAARPNRQFNFGRTSLSKPGSSNIVLGYPEDDSCPWCLNHTYIGANHGDSWASAVICDKEHNLTEKDCGTTWTDSQGKRFHILKIKSPKIVWVISDNVSNDGYSWKFVRPGKTELKDGTGRVIIPAKVEYCQLYSPVRFIHRAYLADGKVLPEKSEVTCSVFTVEEDYDIVSTDAILKHVLNNKGKQVAFNEPGLEAFLSQKIRYTFYPNGSCIVTHDVKFHRDVQLSYMGFLQAEQLCRPKNAKHLYYIPKCLPVELNGMVWDFGNMADFSRPAKGVLYVDPKHYENPQSMPERFVQYLLDSKDMPNVGYAIGYSLIEGCTVPDEHLKNTGRALFLFLNSRKSYPYAIDSTKIPRIKAGSTFYCMAYRQFFSPDQGYYINQQGKSQVMYLDFHEPVQDKRLVFPADLVNKKMSVVEQSPTVTMSKTTDGYQFTSTGKYGYAVLRFDDDGAK